MNPVKTLESNKSQYVKKGSFTPEITSQLAEMGLDLANVKRHSDFIKHSGINSETNFFKIFDTCRIDNGGIIPFKLAADFLKSEKMPIKPSYIAFVPAAGAASRYIQPFEPLAQLIEERSKREYTGEDFVKINTHISRLREMGARDWPLPESLSELLECETIDLTFLSQEKCKQISTDLFLPKALYPCVKDRYTFLQVKDTEHRLIPRIKAQVFITPPSMARVFEMHLHRPHTLPTQDKMRNSIDTLFVEQGPSLSTIRFNIDGTPYRDACDRISIVPAGHGSLAELFFDLRKDFDHCHSLFIRNIDNISGFSREKVDITTDFLGVHEAVLQILIKIRSSLDTNNLAQAAEFSSPLTRFITGTTPKFLLHQLDTIENKVSIEEFHLWNVLAKVFHTSIPNDFSRKNLKLLYARPFNLMGQVPNTQNDVGGTPCFAHYGQNIDKICLEVPHVTEEDRKNILGNPQKATHFNPVFAAAEIPNEPSYYSKRSQEFWLIARKSYRGSHVAYVETVLYELLGNSRLSNCLFIEIPRYLFNPHKAPSDATNKTSDYWSR